MILLAGFTRPVADAQHTFRRTLKAMSEPGTLVTLPVIAALGRLSSAATAVLMTLVDRETPLWLDPAYQSAVSHRCAGDGGVHCALRHSARR